MTAPAPLQLTGVSKSYGSVHALVDIDIEMAPGELLALVGPSGCGKSTLLRAVAGLTAVDAGTVRIAGGVVDDGSTRADPEHRHVGLVFQEHALFPHMTVADNVAFGLRGIGRAERARRRDQWLGIVGLGDHGSRYPHELSGGERQRVALARALAPEPRLMLLDEPFASLDQHLRERLREEVRDIQQRLKITTLFVTHAQDEALAVSDRIVVMRDGGTEQIARPAEVYREPATPFVAGFIGQMNLLDGEVANGRFVHSAFGVPVPVGDGPAILAVRPEALAIAPAADAPMAHIHRVIDYGTHAMVDVELPDGERLKSMMPTADRWSAGQPVDLLPGAFALYRDDAVIHRTADSPTAPQVAGQVRSSVDA
jgi:putative spermidine/putrescine transport system ATP-binding protein